MLQCNRCGKGLVGRQGKFCSTKCRNAYWTLARKLGAETPGFTDPDPAINAFLQDFRELLERHQDAINALAAKRKF